MSFAGWLVCFPLLAIVAMFAIDILGGLILLISWLWG